MTFRRIIYNIRNSLTAHFHIHKTHLIWFGLFVLFGVAVGVITIFNPLLTAAKINKSMLDPNILNAIKVSSFASIIIARFIEFIIFGAFIFVICLHRWTALLCFPLAAFRGFSLVINLYWIFMKFGLLSGFILFTVYFAFLVALVLVFICFALFLMAQCASIRDCGFRAHAWGDFFRISCVFAGIVLVFAFAEWVVYFLVFSRMVFLV